MKRPILEMCWDTNIITVIVIFPSSFSNLPRTFPGLWNTENPWDSLPFKKNVLSLLNFIIFLRFWGEQAFTCMLLTQIKVLMQNQYHRKVCLALSDFRANPVLIWTSLSLSEFPLSHALISVAAFCSCHTTSVIKYLFWINPFN